MSCKPTAPATTTPSTNATPPRNFLIIGAISPWTVREGSGGNHSSLLQRQNGGVHSMYATTRGMLLLATPPLDDPNFDRSVVYMMEHSGEGAVGVVLNHPTDESFVDGLERWQIGRASCRERV